MNTRYFLRLTTSLFAISACFSASARPPKSAVAVFSESDAQFAETVTLYADGSYQQTENEKKTALYRPYSDPLSILGTIKRSGTWIILDKEGGQSIVFKTLTSLPKEAVIEVKGAMPFGVTWERQSPFQSHGTRTLPASEFQPAPPPKK